MLNYIMEMYVVHSRSVIVSQQKLFKCAITEYVLNWIFSFLLMPLVVKHYCGEESQV